MICGLSRGCLGSYPSGSPTSGPPPPLGHVKDWPRRDPTTPNSHSRPQSLFLVKRCFILVQYPKVSLRQFAQYFSVGLCAKTPPHLRTRALTPRKHALVDGHEGPKGCMASGWNSGWNFHGPIHGQMGLRGGLFLTLQSRSDWKYRHGGGSYDQGRRSGVLRDLIKPVPGDLTCTPPEVTIWLIGQVIT